MPGRLIADSDSSRPVIVSGRGVFLEDSRGRRYLDAVGGAHVVTVGHAVAEIAEAVTAQIERVAFVGTRNFVSDVQLELADIIAGMCPEGMSWVQFSSGGSESVEFALQLAHRFQVARGESRRTKFIGLQLGYHGGTIAALSMGGHQVRRQRVYPYLLDFARIPPPYCYRCPFGLAYPGCNLRCASELVDVIEAHGADQICAFIAEPVLGAVAGAVSPPPGYFEVIREICDEYGILLIYDEVITGFGRTGKEFGADHWTATPDLIVCAKGLASGYAPIGAVIAADRIVEIIRAADIGLPPGLTYSGNPVSCAAGIAVQHYIESHDLIAKCAQAGTLLKKLLTDMADRVPMVGDVRGKGLLLGIEFVKNKLTGEPFPRSVGLHERIIAESLRRGLVLVGSGGFANVPDGDHVLVTPPYIISAEEYYMLVATLEESINHVGARVEAAS